MLRALRRFLRSSDATAAVEAAIFAPILVVFTLGITDLGVGTFVGMTVNSAAQAGAAYAVINSGSTGTCGSLTPACISGVQTAMNNATGNSSFCTASSACQVAFNSCADPNGGVCFIVTANYLYSPILPGLYSWAVSQTYSSTATVRIQ